MGKTRWILPVVIFIAFALFGFGIAQIFGRSDLLATILSKRTPTFPPTQASNQQNFLIIHVDDLAGVNPCLVSVWIGFISYFEDQPFIYFKQLYPDPNSPYMREAIIKAFQMDATRKPSPEFIQEIKHFNIPWDGYILMDDFAASEMVTWIQMARPTSPSSENLAPTPEQVITARPGEPDLSLALEPTWIQDLCEHLSRRNFNAGPFQKWSEVMPHHMQTDLTFDTLALTWENLTSSSKPTRCKVTDP
jgi:hypothetical protein